MKISKYTRGAILFVATGLFVAGAVMRTEAQSSVSGQSIQDQYAKQSGIFSSSPLKQVQLRAGDVIAADKKTVIPNKYIVELSEVPLAVKYAEYNSNNISSNSRAAPSPSPRPTAVNPDLSGILSNQKSRIINQQTSFFNALPSSVKAKNSSLQSAISSSNGLKAFDTVLNAVVVNMSESEATAASKISGVKSVESVKVVHADLMDSVPLIHANDAWSGNFKGGSSDNPITGKSVRIAIIDTGVDYTHPDLGGCFGPGCKVFAGYDFVNSDDDPKDDMGHGTHVADIAAGNGSPKGVAPGAAIYAYKVLDKNGSGSVDNIIAGLERAMDPYQDGILSKHVEVASLSLGGSGNPDDDMSKAVDNAVNAGVVVVVAAGNSGPSANTIGSPGTARKAITVAATDKSDAVASFSSHGPVIWTRADGTQGYLDKPDIAAPGVNICAAQFDDAFASQGDTNCNKDTNHVAISGTSMATPHVAGEVALLLQLHPDWTTEEVKSAIRFGVFDGTSCMIGTVFCSRQSYTKYDWGTGRIDVRKLLGSARLPVARLEPIGEVKGVIKIAGSAYSLTGSVSFKISYGAGDFPNSFTDIFNSSDDQSITNKTLYSDLDTTKLDEGKYTVKLMVTDSSGNTSEDRQIMIIRNMAITSVGNTLNYVNDSPQQIRGFVLLPNDSNFTVVADDPQNGPVVCSGNSISVNGVICTANFSKLTGRTHNLYLKVSQNGKIKISVPFEIAVVHEMLDNFPVETFAFPIGVQQVYSLSNDSGKKLVIPHLTTDMGGGWFSGTGLQFYDKNGSYKTLLSLADGSKLPDANSSVYQDSKTGNARIFEAGNESTIFDGSGTIYLSWKTGSGLFFKTSILDGDEPGNPVFYSVGLNSSFDPASPHQIVLTGHDDKGRLLDGFPISVPTISPLGIASNLQVSFLKGESSGKEHQIIQTKAIMEVSYSPDDKGRMNDPKLYLHTIFADKSIKDTLLYDGTGNKGFSIALPYSATADLNGDGNIEMVVGYAVVDNDLSSKNSSDSNAYTSYFKVIDVNGDVMASASPIKGYIVGYFAPGAIAVGNLGQKNPTIVANLQDTYASSGTGEKIIAFDGGLNKIFEKNEGSLNATSPILNGITIGDVDGDGLSEIVINYRPRWWRGDSSGIQIMDGNGLLKRNIQIPTLGAVDDYEAYPAVLDDFDGDGNVDVTLQSAFRMDANSSKSSVRLYAINLGGKYVQGKIDWGTTLHDNQNTACFNCTISSTDTSSSTATSTEPVENVLPLVSILGTPTLSLQYGQSGNEASLISSFYVSIGAGSEDQKISKKYAFNSYLLSKDGGYFDSPDQQYLKPDGVKDADGDFYIIPAHTTAVFNVQITYNPKQMFAGSYYGVLGQVRLGDYSNPNWIKIPEPNTTNTLVVIGEQSPYINSVSPNPVPSDKTVTITGVRFSKDQANTIKLNSFSNACPMNSSCSVNKQYSLISTHIPSCGNSSI